MIDGALLAAWVAFLVMLVAGALGAIAVAMAATVTGLAILGADAWLHGRRR